MMLELPVAAAGGAPGGGATMVLTPDIILEEVLVPFCWMAMAWNIDCVFVEVGLMLKVMPLPQWTSGVF